MGIPGICNKRKEADTDALWTDGSIAQKGWMFSPGFHRVHQLAKGIRICQPDAGSGLRDSFVFLRSAGIAVSCGCFSTAGPVTQRNPGNWAFHGLSLIHI